MSKRSEARQRRRKDWFDLGARAVQRMWPEAPYCYVCPICGPRKAYLPSAIESRVVTFEHAPPKSLGGNEVALTCCDCNSAAGAQLDIEMLSRDRVLDFAMGTMKHSMRCYLEMDGDTVLVDYQNSGGSVSFVGLGAHNNPLSIQNWEQKLESRASAEGSRNLKFNVTPTTRYHPKRAFIGWLRSAYLIAFAALGYKYIFDPNLKTVREQLIDVHSETLRYFSVTVPDAPTADKRLMVVKQPENLQSLAVQMGRTIVFLPWFEPGEDLYNRLAECASNNERYTTDMSGKLVEWPNSPKLALDFI